MKKAEQIISLLWIALATWVCIESFELELGSFSNPGPGFLPFGAGVFLGTFAVAHLVNVTLKHGSRKALELSWSNVNWEKGVYVVIALFVFTFFLPRLGYLIDTFLLMLFLFSILERMKWWIILSSTLAVILVMYLVFSVWLMVQFPKGFLRIG